MESESQNLERGIMHRVILPILISSILFFSAAKALTNLTLQGAIKTALEKNRTLLIHKEEIEKAEGAVTEARANFLPTLSISGSYTRLAEVPELEFAVPVFDTLQIPVFDDLGNPIGYTYVPGITGMRRSAFKMGEENNYMGRFSLQQPIFTWGRVWNSYEIAKLNFRAAEEGYRKRENEVVFDVTEAFYRVLYLEELVKLTGESYKQIKRHLSVVEKRYDAGLASKFDLIRARVQLANMEPQVLKVKDGLKMAKARLKILLGLPLDEEVELKGELEYESTQVDLAQAIKEALSRRPELNELKLRKAMAEKALAIASASNKPSLALLVNYSYQKPYQFEDEWGGNWDATLALQIPLFSGGATSGKIQQARAKLHQAELGLEMLRDAVELEVRNAVLELEETAKLVKSQKENVHQAEVALEIAEERYENGLMTSLEVMDAQLALTQAKTNYLQALSGYLIARSKLKKVVGGRNYEKELQKN